MKALLLFISMISISVAAPTRVGNGNDGRDLENLKPITAGPIYESRLSTVQYLRTMNINAVPGLGSLIPEVERTKLFLAEKDVVDGEKMGGYHTDMTGRVYARTFATPNSPTRFFPASLKLSQEQLRALHIHEGLHRALPPSIRENESKVAKLTLAMVSPETSYDNIKAVAASVMPVPQSPTIVPAELVVSERSRLKSPSTFSIDVRSYLAAKESATQSASVPIGQIYTLSSHLYPFGTKSSNAFGLGIDYSFIATENDNIAGPLGLSGRLLLFTAKEFDFEIFASANLNTLSDEEIQQSFLGRDIYTAGITMKKAFKGIYLENDLSYTLSTTAEETIGNVDYQYNFGSVIMAKVKAGGYVGNFYFGGFGEIYLAETTAVDGGAFSLAGGDRYRILAVGPEIEWRTRHFGVKLFGRFMLDSTKEVDFDQLGNMMGVGAGQGFIGLGLSFSI